MLRARRAVPACKPEHVLQGKGEGCEEDRLRRLRWRCRRGLLELDLWLERFAERELNRLSDVECDALEVLLEEADADMLAWLEGRQPAPGNHARVIEIIRASI